MKSLVFIFILSMMVVLLNFTNTSIDNKQTVNPILGDISYELKFGEKPNALTDNHLRIKTHLAYVEGLLRQKDVSDMPIELQANRKLLLDKLHEYHVMGVFPKNYDYQDQRKPCFIDKEGTICAVGYLIEQTTNEAVVNEINEKFKYDELLAMNDGVVDRWVSQSGLTKEECAMIQPTYGPNPVKSHISTENAISSSLVGGLNLSLSTINAIQIGKGSAGKTLPILGLATGAGQIAMGIATMPKEEVDFWGHTSINESQKKLSIANIGVGASTLLISTWNLIRNREPRKNKMTHWDIHSVPSSTGNDGLALSFTRTF